ncbi:MAG: hypothetical protein CMN55_00705 [Sneathiella sp.]|uniref:flagellar hook-length control protein FliK n=1 Tax=Sneathiella sp. TaxID=1964365 RepID=UPI000C511FBD|nr:flagellar hook-length control protein FliK [Sneathiella sp.]MAL77632.1 hypothetical protein [Sneathiella sp.]
MRDRINCEKHVMDVGQVLGMTSEPPRRDKDVPKAGEDGFSSFLKDPAAKERPSAKNADGASTANGTPDNGKMDKSAANSEKTTTAEAPTDKDDKRADPSPALPKGETKGAATTGNPLTKDGEPSPVETANGNEETIALPTGMPADAQPEIDLTQGIITDPGKAEIKKQGDAAPVPTLAQKEAGASALLPTQPPKDAGATADPKVAPHASGEAKTAESALMQAAAAGNRERSAPQANQPTSGKAEVATDLVPPKALETVRAEATAKMSEKDILSAKIAEMLRDGNGSLAANAGKKQSFQSTLASSTTLVTASMAANPAATPNAAPSALANAQMQMGGLIPQTTHPAPSSTQQGMTPDTTAQIMPTAPTGAIQHVEATAANNASQAANAARAAHAPVAEQLSTHISSAIKEGHDRIKISLHPSELGRVEVKLDIGHDGRLLAAVSVDRQETLDLLQRDARSLERALQNAGFDTGSNSLNFSLRQDGGEGHERGAGFAGLEPSPDRLPDDDIWAETPLPAYTGSGRNDGNLDIQV